MTVYSILLIVPAGYEGIANKFEVALGRDIGSGRTFTIPMSANGLAPATHYGCHTWAPKSFLDLMNLSLQGTLPPIRWTDYGTTEKDVRDTLSVLVMHSSLSLDAEQAVKASGLKIISPGV